MALNWIKHSAYRKITPQAAYDRTFVDGAQVTEFFRRLHESTLTHCVFPAGLQTRLKYSDPDDGCAIVVEALESGWIKDTFWYEDYHNSAEEVSRSMQGFPVSCLRQWQRLEKIVSQLDPQRICSDSTRNGGIAQGDQPESTPGFPFLKLPAEIRDRIYRYLVCCGPILVTDWKLGNFPSTAFRRTEYDVFDVSVSQTRRTTYIVKTNRGPQFDLAIMLVNKMVHEEAARVFYSQPFMFLGTAESTLSFMHDILRKLDYMQKISIVFSTDDQRRFLGCLQPNLGKPEGYPKKYRSRLFHIRDQDMTDIWLPLPPRTSIPTWRRIFNVLVHQSLGLLDFELIIDDSFWEKVPWKQGYEVVFNQSKLCEPRGLRGRKEDRNFLQHVARLSGVNFRLSVEGTGSDKARMAFRRSLEKHIWEQMARRPYLADDVVSKCTCRRRLMHECCIWDREGKSRRGG